jgi:hypothetical protein
MHTNVKNFRGEHNIMHNVLIFVFKYDDPFMMFSLNQNIRAFGANITGH